MARQKSSGDHDRFWTVVRRAGLLATVIGALIGILTQLPRINEGISYIGEVIGIVPRPTPTPTLVIPSPTPSPTPLTSYSTPFPGPCDPNRSDKVLWVNVKSTISCSNQGTTITKLQGWNGAANPGFAELRFSIPGQVIPTSYSVAVTVSAMQDPDGRTPACAGLEVHTGSDALTLDELSVCASGEYVIASHRDGASNYPKDDHVMPPSNTGVYLLKAEVSSSRVKLTVNNNAGTVATLSDAPVLTTTAYIGLEVTWLHAGASARFSDFLYSGS